MKRVIFFLFVIVASLCAARGQSVERVNDACVYFNVTWWDFDIERDGANSGGITHPAGLYCWDGAKLAPQSAPSRPPSRIELPERYRSPSEARSVRKRDSAQGGGGAQARTQRSGGGASAEPCVTWSLN